MPRSSHTAAGCWSILVIPYLPFLLDFRRSEKVYKSQNRSFLTKQPSKKSIQPFWMSPTPSTDCRDNVH